jgi:hypothetical protein
VNRRSAAVETHQLALTGFPPIVPANQTSKATCQTRDAIDQPHDSLVMIRRDFKLSRSPAQVRRILDADFKSAAAIEDHRRPFTGASRSLRAFGGALAHQRCWLTPKMPRPARLPEGSMCGSTSRSHPIRLPPKRARVLQQRAHLAEKGCFPMSSQDNQLVRLFHVEP